MPPNVQAPLTELIAGATRVEVEGSGHMVSIEQPSVFDSIIDGFLEARSRP
jgi:pimeloyl-ACP methyl ester carboxylesterase